MIEQWRFAQAAKTELLVLVFDLTGNRFNCIVLIACACPAARSTFETWFTVVVKS